MFLALNLAQLANYIHIFRGLVPSSPQSSIFSSSPPLFSGVGPLTVIVALPIILVISFSDFILLFFFLLPGGLTLPHPYYMEAGRKEYARNDFAFLAA